MRAMNDLDTLLTTKQLQDLLQVDRITIYRMLGDGRLRGFKVGGQWRFSRREIEAWLQEQQAGLEAAEAPPADAELHPSPETLPLACIQAIQSVFGEALGLGTITTAVNGEPLTELSNSCEFCNLIYRTEAGRQQCITSWQAAAGQPGATPQLATCHAGLRYVWGRIVVQGEFVAATYAGQFLDRSPNGDWPARIARLSALTGVEEEKLRDALDRVPVLDETRLQQVPRLLQRVAETFSEIGEERLNLLGRLQRIAKLVNW